ncbi:hypothetical protein EJB05_46869 [Eragrostis curvula]|uniref:Uncharacterized protein n=1 Tax=Eragrostis curvula TaxID=38414 RepID=A0A5J9T6D9_9POAL|nr:hypothetical protein EJB05_46869 [Eragrostis curvula]
MAYPRSWNLCHMLQELFHHEGPNCSRIPQREKLADRLFISYKDVQELIQRGDTQDPWLKPFRDSGDMCAVLLAKELIDLGRSDTLELIFGVWVEMMFYAADHRSRDSHGRQLSNGGVSSLPSCGFSCTTGCTSHDTTNSLRCYRVGTLPMSQISMCDPHAPRNTMEIFVLEATENFRGNMEIFVVIGIHNNTKALLNRPSVCLCVLVMLHFDVVPIVQEQSGLIEDESAGFISFII